jgi:hypothetical protein
MEGRMKGLVLKDSVKFILGKNGVCHIIVCQMKLLLLYKMLPYYGDIFFALKVRHLQDILHQTKCYVVISVLGKFGGFPVIL